MGEVIGRLPELWLDFHVILHLFQVWLDQRGIAWEHLSFAAQGEKVEAQEEENSSFQDSYVA
jgi:hypothetical protein